MKSVPLKEIIFSKSESITPAKYPDETFELFSIPSYDVNLPEYTLGNNIGSAKKEVFPGDVLLSRIVPHIRRSWIVPQSSGKRQIASGEWIVFRSSLVNPCYLRHFLLSDIFHVQFMKTVAGVGGSLLRARISGVEEISIPLPSLSEQNRIAEILDKADAIRRKRRQALQLADELLRSAFLDLFGDPIVNSKSWQTQPLGELGLLSRGKSMHRPRNDPKLLGGPYPLVQTGDVTQSSNYLSKYTQTYSELGLKQSKLWPKGTLCITIAANIADTAILGFDACFPDSVVGFIPNDKLKIEFVHMWFSLYKKLIKASAPESAQKNINLEILSNLQVTVPPIELQQKFKTIFLNVEQLKFKQYESTKDCQHMFNSLSHKAFSGDI